MAHKQTHKQKAKDSMQMKLVLLKRKNFEVHYSDTTAADIDASRSEDDREEARQYICGKLFKELWSDDAANGFQG